MLVVVEIGMSASGSSCSILSTGLGLDLAAMSAVVGRPIFLLPRVRLRIADETAETDPTLWDRSWLVEQWIGSFTYRQNSHITNSAVGASCVMPFCLNVIF